ncbi:PREDICTED: protein phosphatase 2C 37-like [Ipomoea nil]|uniref:protein phosphatase 2C 37-like n=1 Tax=Ipomoea nil TaxID=35883 RepID=UPI00090171C3|nr:PREDICTED: protein phosphatase 2C 37-like [Ipomoea nil]
MATKFGDETETSTPFRFVVADVTVTPSSENGQKRKRVEVSPVYAEGESEKSGSEKKVVKNKISGSPKSVVSGGVSDEPRFSIMSVCGRRKEIEDAVAINPFFSRKTYGNSNDLHFFGVYDGHDYLHVAVKCNDQMH